MQGYLFLGFRPPHDSVEAAPTSPIQVVCLVMQAPVADGTNSSEVYDDDHQQTITRGHGNIKDIVDRYSIGIAPRPDCLVAVQEQTEYSAGQLCIAELSESVVVLLQIRAVVALQLKENEHNQ